MVIRNRGFILIIVLALLGVMAFLALELVQSSQTTRQLGLKQIHTAKARLAGRSGLEKIVVGCRHWGWRYGQSIPFEQRLEAAGDDRNRNGLLDPATEDPKGDGILHPFRSIEDDPTPSMALAEPGSSPTRALSINLDGVPTGATWVDARDRPTSMACVQASSAFIDLNAGIDAGRSAEGQKFRILAGYSSYDAVSWDHPWNAPLVRLLNAWGNVKKYEAMAITKTYNWSPPNEIDSAANLAANSTEAISPSARFDAFYPSERCPGEIPLGRMLIAQRPPSGFSHVEEAIPFVEKYVKGWKDKNGNLGITGSWLRFDGTTPIPALDETKVQALLNEFRRLASTVAVRRPVPWPIKRRLPVARAGTTDPLAVTSDNSFWGDNNAVRSAMDVEMLFPAMHSLSLNAMPESLLTACLASIGAVACDQYSITPLLQPFGISPPTYLHATMENNYLNTPTAVRPVLDAVRQKPIFSFTECLGLTRRLRSRFPLTDYAQLHALIATWDGGYDGKKNSAGFPPYAPSKYTTNGAENEKYFDIFSGFQRGRIVAAILNPHLNLGRLVWDEALPKALDNRINSLGKAGTFSTATGNRPFETRLMFDKVNTYGFGAFTRLNGGDWVLRSLGRHCDADGRVLARALLTTAVAVYDVVDIHTQKDWERACTDPLSGASQLAPRKPTGTWVSYPEAPGVAPSNYDGHLALRPALKTTSPPNWGSALRARIPLSPYEELPDPVTGYPAGKHPTRDLTGKDVWPEGTRTAPYETLTLRNSLNPASESLGPTALLAPASNAIDGTSDLLPGGGMRVTPWHNPSHLSPVNQLSSDPNRKEALLVLRNSLVSDAVDAACPDSTVNPGIVAKVLPNFHEGVVSFWFKPKFTAPAHFNLMNPNQTLFFFPFVINDEDTHNDCLAMPAPYNAEASARRWYVGNIRLNWTQGYWFNASFPLNATPFLAYQGVATWAAVRNPWPFVPPFSGPTSTPPAMGCNQSNAGPHYFLNMSGPTGLPYPGELVCACTNFNGTLSTSAASRHFDQSGSWDPVYARANKGVWGRPNPFPGEALVLEFNLSKAADYDYEIVSVPDPSLPNMNPTWNLWNGLDEMGPLATACAYNNPAGYALNIFDTSGMAPNGLADYHSVRKCFNLFHPVEYSTNAATRGQGPRDSSGYRQPMLAPGRWNHLLIAWRNLYDVLDNSVASHRGGCLGVYVNGHLRKISPSNHQLAGLFVQTDACQGFKSTAGDPAWWYPGLTHPFYDASFGVDPYNSIYKGYTIPERGQPALGVGGAIGPSYFFPTQYLGLVRNINSDPRYLSPSHVYLGQYQESYMNVMPDLYRDLPSRFYFGCHPINGFNVWGWSRKRHFSVSGVTWGAFMDIQIYDKPSSILPSPVDDGGFIDSLPNFSAQSPYPQDAMVDIFPLNVLSASQRARVASVSWSAHLPEFHKFWDDAAPAGPDAEDSQQLRLEVVINGTTVETLGKSQHPSWPTYGPSRASWTATNPTAIASANDLKLTLRFKNAQTLPPASRNAVLATPVIEAIEVILLSEPRYGPIQWQ